MLRIHLVVATDFFSSFPPSSRVHGCVRACVCLARTRMWSDIYEPRSAIKLIFRAFFSSNFRPGCCCRRCFCCCCCCQICTKLLVRASAIWNGSRAVLVIFFLLFIVSCRSWWLSRSVWRACARTIKCEFQTMKCEKLLFIAGISLGDFFFLSVLLLTLLFLQKMFIPFSGFFSLANVPKHKSNAMNWQHRILSLSHWTAENNRNQNQTQMENEETQNGEGKNVQMGLHLL